MTRLSVYARSNLVSDVPGMAVTLDTKLVNAWGIAFGGPSPFWVNANATGVSEAVFKAGFTPTASTPQTITIPSATGTGNGAPTGIVFNDTGGFTITNNGSTSPAAYLFASEDGIITAWRPPSATPAVISPAVTVIDNSASGAVYKGLTVVGIGQSAFIHAANFHAGKIDIWDSTFAPVTPGTHGIAAGAFTDPNLPSGYSPFNITRVGTNIMVTYALENAAGHDDVKGAGHGVVDLFTNRGAFIRRFATGGTLDSPWGVTVAPGSFGQHAHDILIGNFGDGRISAFNTRGRFRGFLNDSTGAPIQLDGLWGLTFGNGVNAGSPRTLFFAAGPSGETHGLFGSIDLLKKR